LGRNGKGIYVRVHPKSWKKMKTRLKELTSRRSVRSIRPSLEKIKVYMRGWLNYYGVADMKNNIEEVNAWLCHRIRMCIWKQWKLPRTKRRNLMKLGIPEYFAHMAANSRKGYWFTSATSTVNRALSKERLIRAGFYDLTSAYQSVHVNY
jgi:RNA-directed DNA polymerase